MDRSVECRGIRASEAHARCCVVLGISLLLAGCPSGQVRQAEHLAAEGRLDDAVELYRKASRQDPFNERLQEQLDEATRQAAATHYEEARRLLADKRMGEALPELKRAVGFDPSRPDYHLALHDTLRLKDARDRFAEANTFRELGRFDEAMASYQQAVRLDPDLTPAIEAITALAHQQRSIQESGKPYQPVTLRFQATKLKEAVEILARSGSINVIFDKDIRDEPVTLFIKDKSFDEALDLILTMNGLVAHRISADTLLIIPNTQPKQLQFKDMMIRTFYLSNTKAKDAVNLVKTMLDSKRVYVDEKINAILVRDEAEKVLMAERMIHAIDRRDPEVLLDVEVLEVNRTKTMKYGLDFAKQAGFGVIPPGSTGGVSTGATAFTFRQLTSIGTGSYLFTLPASVLLDFFKQESDAKTLASPKIRVLNNKSASINVGDKQPILLSTTNVLPGQAATGAVPTTSTVTSIEYKDIGVKLTVEPTIHLTNELTLKMKVEVTSLGDQVTLQSSPEIKQFRFGTRTAETILMMKDEETVVMAGLLQDQQRKTRSTVPWLGDIPLIGYLFGANTQDTIQTEVILTITPHIVRNLDVPTLAEHAYWSGTDANYSLARPFARKTAIATDVTRTHRAPADSMAPSPRPSQADQSQMVERLIEQTASSTQGVTERTTRFSGWSLSPSQVTGAVGHDFMVSLDARAVGPGAPSVATLFYDPTAIAFDHVVHGAETLSIQNNPGRLLLSLSAAVDGTGASSPMAQLAFRGLRAGEWQIRLQPASMGGDTTTAGPSIIVVLVQP